jgi:hypothetical protein
VKKICETTGRPEIRQIIHALVTGVPVVCFEKHPYVFQTLHVMYRYGYLSILLVILLCLGSQIEIFGEAPPDLKSEPKTQIRVC